MTFSYYLFPYIYTNNPTDDDDMISYHIRRYMLSVQIEKLFADGQLYSRIQKGYIKER